MPDYSLVSRWPLPVLLLGVMSLWAIAPFMPGVEGKLFPVSSPPRLIQQTPIQGGIRATYAFTKYHDCEFIGSDWRNASGDAVRLSPADETGEINAQVRTGETVLTRDFIGASDWSELSAQSFHRCHPFWLRKTIVKD